MKSRCLLIFLLCLCLLCGCVKVTHDKNPQTSDSSVATTENQEMSEISMAQAKYQRVEHIGQVPEELQAVIQSNEFEDITVFSDRLLKFERFNLDEENRTVSHLVKMMDLYGNELAEYAVTIDDAYYINTLTATADGGFLFVLGFDDYAYDQNTWASDQGYASRIIKCDKNGNLEFDTPLDRVEVSALKFCFEKNGNLYFFGTRQTPETKTRGVHSPTDIYMTILSSSGIVLKTQCIAGSDYDSLDAAEVDGNSFLLSMSSQSDDGDFVGSNSKGYPIDWVVRVNDELEIVEMEQTAGRDYADFQIGEIDGAPIYQSSDLLNSFDVGYVTAFIDYGDYYLIVSQNIIGERETPPYISAIWYNYETVYSGYDYEGNLIFRTAVDS